MMKYYVLGYSNTDAKELLLAFEDDYNSAYDFASKVDGTVIGIDDKGTPSLWPEPDPIEYMSMIEVLGS